MIVIDDGLSDTDGSTLCALSHVTSTTSLTTPLEDLYSASQKDTKIVNAKPKEIFEFLLLPHYSEH